MNTFLKKLTVKNVVLFLIAAVAFQAFIQYSFKNDPLAIKAEQVVRDNSRVKNELGQVGEIDLIRRSVVRASNISPEYRIYDFLVRGEKAKGSVEIRVDGKLDASTFSVKSFAKL